MPRGLFCRHRCATAFRHTTTLRRPPGCSHSTTTTRSFHPAATAGILVAGAWRQVIQTQTSGCASRGAQTIGSGPYAGSGSVVGYWSAAAWSIRWSLRSS